MQTKSLFAVMLLLPACSSATAQDENPSVSQALVEDPCAVMPSSLGADGWGNYYADGTRKTIGGENADAAHRYRISSRSELIKALYPDAVIAQNGSFTSAAGADATPKILCVTAKVNLSVDGNNDELHYEDFKDPSFDFEAYVAAYKPSVWNANPLNWNAATNKPNKVSGPLESARVASAQRQGQVVAIRVGSNTSIIGVGGHAKISYGSLVLGEGVDNVVIRNLLLEDAFDYFPLWDPSDSFVLDPSQPGCQAAYVDTGTGPQKCPGGRWNSLYDNIQVIGAKHVWIDHNAFTDGTREDYKFPSVFDAPHVGYDYLVQHHDGAADVTGTSDFVTISYNHFKNHDKTNLLGSSDTPTLANGIGALSITVHHNYYENAGQRLPRVRFGKVHIYNNYYKGRIGYDTPTAPTDGSAVPPNRMLYGIGIGYLAKIFSENNVFEVTSARGPVSESIMFYNWHKASPTAGTGLDVGQKTFFRDTGSTLNGKVVDIFTAANLSALANGRPALEKTDTIWNPKQSYEYSLQAAERVKASVKSSAGAEL